jgi:hypothetical protein
MYKVTQVQVSAKMSRYGDVQRGVGQSGSTEIGMTIQPVAGATWTEQEAQAEAMRCRQHLHGLLTLVDHVQGRSVAGQMPVDEAQLEQQRLSFVTLVQVLEGRNAPSSQ